MNSLILMIIRTLKYLSLCLTSVVHFHFGFFLLVYLMSFVFLLSAAFCLFSVNFFCAYSCVGRLGNFIPLSSYQAIVVNR